MANKNILDDIFGAEEKDVETFGDIVKMNQKDFAPREVLQLKKTANFTSATQKFLNITHGTHEENYVWHIRPAHPKRPWAVSTSRVIYAIGRVIHEHLPRDMMVDIFPPKVGWDIEEITVKANDAMSHWSVTQADLDKVTGQFFEVLNPLM